MKLIKKILLFVLVLGIVVVTFTGCTTNASNDNSEGTGISSLSDIENGTIGIMTGSSHDGTVKEIFPKAERVYFNTVADMVLATEQGKIDGYIEDEPFLAAVLWEGSNVKRLDESVKKVNNGFVFPQSEESHMLREQVNKFIAESKADGTLDNMINEWLNGDEPSELPDYMSLSGENGTIRLAVSVEN